ncbi:hypothetical protein EV182_000723 [Spiromyces aspiralis]|uniref:Uncharacterized protein n=1 Tax=Spiromyces aspiralis TaxID=68401 RepID=A0ACC1HXM1_9FUNG|nr:hypothetical protein EV182_000723 [Spiromyces aspiralis]
MSLDAAIYSAQRTIASFPLPVYVKFVTVVIAEFIFNILYIISGGPSDAENRANSGIGYPTAKALAKAGYHVIMACRNEDDTRDKIAKLELETGLCGSFEFMRLDLSSFHSIDAFTEAFRAKRLPIHIFVANAGIMLIPTYETTVNNIETHFGVNHIGHFRLIMGLLDIIKASEPARIILVGSITSYLTTKIDYDYILNKDAYIPIYSYANSKLANAMFANALARRLKGTKVTVNSLHPGAVATELYRYIPGQYAVKQSHKVLYLPSNEGAATSIYLALSPEVEGMSGQFWSRESLKTHHNFATRVEEQEKLWKFTESLMADSEKGLR